MEAEPGGKNEDTAREAANSAQHRATEPGGDAGTGSEPEAPVHSSPAAGRMQADPSADGGYVPKPAPTTPEPPPHPGLFTTRRVALLAILCGVLISSILYLRHRADLLNRLKAGAEKAKEVLTGEPSTPRDSYAEAVLKVEANRGEATGRAATIEVPAELKQYREPRRFLAVQGASAAEAGFTPPHDFAELARVIKGGRDFVEAPRLGRGYVLYGVGLTATGELTHYDASARKNVPLFAGADELRAFRESLAADRTRLGTELKEVEAALKALPRAERDERARLLKESAARKKELTRLQETGDLIDSYYGRDGTAGGAKGSGGGAQTGAPDGGNVAAPEPRKAESAAEPKAESKGKAKPAAKPTAKPTAKPAAAGRRQPAAPERRAGDSQRRAGGGQAGGGRGLTSERLFAEYGALAEMARDFGGRTYDLHDRASAKEFQARLLSYLRPPALAVLEELAMAYQAKFDRPLPVTSLVRTEEYQRLLRESGNPNAADVAPPPHTTGLAFDIYYRFMTAAEQEFVMGEIARLEREGRVEALRELRDHYHVFVFPEGRPPAAQTVDRMLGRRARPERPEQPEQRETAKRTEKQPQKSKKR